MNRPSLDAHALHAHTRTKKPRGDERKETKRNETKRRDRGVKVELSSQSRGGCTLCTKFVQKRHPMSILTIHNPKKYEFNVNSEL